MIIEKIQNIRNTFILEAKVRAIEYQIKRKWRPGAVVHVFLATWETKGRRSRI